MHQKSMLGALHYVETFLRSCYNNSMSIYGFNFTGIGNCVGGIVRAAGCVGGGFIGICSVNIKTIVPYFPE